MTGLAFLLVVVSLVVAIVTASAAVSRWQDRRDVARRLAIRDKQLEAERDRAKDPRDLAERLRRDGGL